MKIRDLDPKTNLKGIEIITNQRIRGIIISQEILLKLQSSKEVPIKIDSLKELFELDIVSIPIQNEIEEQKVQKNIL